MVEPERRQPDSGSATEPPSPVRLVLLSFLMLFVELGLIRWSGAYVVYLAFFTNFVLARELPRRRCGIPPRPGSR